MGKSADVPEPPDYAALAGVEGDLNRELVLGQTYANRPRQETPWSTVDWTSSYYIDPATGDPVSKWTQSTTLPERISDAFIDQSRVAQARSNRAANILVSQGGFLGSPVDYSQFADIPEVGDPMRLRTRAEDATMDRLRSRLDPQFEERGEALEVQLRNRGLMPGDEAYEAEMDRFDRARTDAYQAAMNEAIGVGRQEASQLFDQDAQRMQLMSGLRNQQIVEELRRRMQPVEDVNALLAGQGFQPAYGPGFSTAGTTTAPNLTGAAGATYGAQADAYNADQAARQGLYSGITNLASIGLGFLSDRRLKRHIKHIGYWMGRKLYHYQYVWGAWSVGVMSDEVNPEAVHKHPSGYDVVDYTAVTPA